VIRILIAEDELAPARYLKSLIELQGEDFEVVGVARHGKEALEMATSLDPDMLITDVRMPLMDGIALLEEFRRSFPAIPTLIVSGFQEFEYARKALALGVNDYLLKPVDPAKLRKLLDDLGGRIKTRRRERLLGDVERLIEDLAPEGPTPRRFLIALVRDGGPLLQSQLSRIINDGPNWDGDLLRFPGRDSREFLYLADADLVRRDVLESRLEAETECLKWETRTILFPEHSVVATELSRTVRELGLELDRFVTIGRRTTIGRPLKESHQVELEAITAQQIRLALHARALNSIKATIGDQVGRWCRCAGTAREVTQGLRQILFLAQEESAGRREAAADWEFLLEQGISRSDTIEEVIELAQGLFMQVAGLEGMESGPTDAPETHQRVRRFLQSHYAEPLSLALVCERFAISQTYLSKLFRRYDSCTFHDYLTHLRLDAAERLLKENPGMGLKTVAACVGYQDQFHFSRAFKAAKGISPSELRSRN